MNKRYFKFIDGKKNIFLSQTFDKNGSTKIGNHLRIQFTYYNSIQKLKTVM